MPPLPSIFERLCTRLDFNFDKDGERLDRESLIDLSSSCLSWAKSSGRFQSDDIYATFERSTMHLARGDICPYVKVRPISFDSLKHGFRAQEEHEC